MTKVGLALLMSKFKFELVDKKFYNEELKLKKLDISTSADGKIELRARLR